MNHDLPTAWVNGEPQTTISIFDRGLMYGQSVFETICVFEQNPLLLDAHLRRLKKGCDTIGIGSNEDILRAEIANACATLSDNSRVILRICVTMGEGGRGYKNPQQPHPNRIISLHPYPDHPALYWHDGVNIGVVDIRLSNQPLLAGLKHSNRLEQTIARSQWQTDWQEALVLNEQNQIVEATQSNVFIISDGVLKTPDLDKAGVAGVMREFILSQASSLNFETHIGELSMDDIYRADEVFLSNSVIGLWPVKQCQEQRFSEHTVTRTLQTTCQDHGLIPYI